MRKNIQLSLVAIFVILSAAIVAYQYWGAPARDNAVAECKLIAYADLASVPVDSLKPTNDPVNARFYDRFADIFIACMEAKRYRLDSIAYSNALTRAEKQDEGFGIKDLSNYPFQQYTYAVIPEFWRKRFP